MARKKIEYKDAGDHFRKMANKRAKQIIKYANLINGMLPQPSYDISPEDAQKLVSYLNNEVSSLLTNLQKIADGQTLKEKKEIEDVF